MASGWLRAWAGDRAGGTGRLHRQPRERWRGVLEVCGRADGGVVAGRHEAGKRSMSEMMRQPITCAAAAGVSEKRIEKTPAGVLVEMRPPSTGLVFALFVPWVIVLIGAVMFVM